MPKNKLNIDLPSPKQLDQLTGPYSDQELSEPSEEQLHKLMEFFDQYGIDYSKFKPEHISFLSGKFAYPNYNDYITVQPRYDIKRWLMAMKDIAYKQKAGLSYQDSIRRATTNWKKMEVFDFLNWLRFYQEGTPMKYKTAQNWYENNQPGYFLHIKKDEPEKEPVDEMALQEEADRNEEKKRIIENQRKKIIGRLDSAEKLLRMPEGQSFAGPELENLMEAIYNLKKKVQLVNKLSVSTRLYEDMIVREANVLSRRGFIKAAVALYSIAQTPEAVAESARGTSNKGKLPEPTSPPDPSGAGQQGVPAGWPSTAPGVPSIESTTNQDSNNQPPAKALVGNPDPKATVESSPAIIPQEAPQPDGIKQFIENMNQGNRAGDDLEVRDHEEELMVSEAQVNPREIEDIPITTSPAPERGNVANLPPPKEKVEKPLEVKEEDIPAIKEKMPISPGGDLTVPSDIVMPKDSGFDKKVDSFFNNATMADIVSELENLSKIFKTREIPHRLSIVDLMLDAKGLASFFPSLSEAQKSSLDSNNYCSTRVDDILAKIKGSLKSEDVDLVGGTDNNSETAGIRSKLQQDDEREKSRKDRKKNQELNEGIVPAKETPQVDMEGLTPKTPIVPQV
jgi:hypothetical protein